MKIYSITDINLDLDTLIESSIKNIQNKKP